MPKKEWNKHLRDARSGKIKLRVKDGSPKWIKQSQSRKSKKVPAVAKSSDDKSTTTLKIVKFRVADVQVVGEHRPLVQKKVQSIAKSMKAIGQKTPITVHMSKKGPGLDAGHHRLAAAKSLGWETIDCFVTTDDMIGRKLWTIAENLHRAGLTKQQRAEQVAKWDKLIKERDKDAQVKHPGGRQPHDKGVSKTAKDLGISRDEVRRSKKIASISRKGKKAIKSAGLDNNQDAMVAIANETTPEKQVKKARAIAKKQKTEVLKGPLPKEVKLLEALKLAFNRDGKFKKAWDATTTAVRLKFIKSVLMPLV